MNKYIVLLRGINVSGHKKIKMSELKFHFEEIGFSNVTTYIQSGNIIFCSGIRNVEKIKNLIEKKINEVYNFNVPVIVLTQIKIKEILSKIPFNIKEIDTKNIAITFLSSVPNPSLINNILPLCTDEEKFILDAEVIYFYSSIGFGKTKFTNSFFENKLKVVATSRNWKTTNKLYKIITELNCEN